MEQLPPQQQEQLELPPQQLVLVAAARQGRVESSQAQLKFPQQQLVLIAAAQQGLVESSEQNGRGSGRLTGPALGVGVVPTGEIGTNLLSVLVAATIGTTRVTSATGLPADL